MSTTHLTLLFATVFILVAVVCVIHMRRRLRQEKARRRYGPEYERAARELGSEREAEHDLQKRREKVDDEVIPLSDADRKHFDEMWHVIERTFIADPGTALESADRMVAEVLHARNFPVDSRRKSSESVGVVYPDIVEDFREAQQIHEGSVGSSYGESSSQENMRRAFRKYRAVYNRLK